MKAQQPLVDTVHNYKAKCHFIINVCLSSFFILPISLELVIYSTLIVAKMHFLFKLYAVLCPKILKYNNYFFHLSTRYYLFNFGLLLIFKLFIIS